jgi:ATPase subunit of ABC transporter with duplicated ATPase domains
VDLERPAHSLSGGERTRLLLAGLLLRDPEIVLLDEPTNNLDEEGRQVILAFLQQWRGPTLVASHDRDLLASVGKIAELTRTGIRVVGGGWDEFERIRTAERVRVIEAADKAAAEVRTARRERQREAEKQARRDKRGRAVAAKDADPRIYLGAQKQRAEMTAARYRAVGGELLDRATDTFEEARAKVERDIAIRISLPASGLSSRHLLVNARGVSVERGGRQLFEPLDLSIVGPERVAITGRNGSGKTSLIRVILGLDAPAGGTIAADRERAALLDQEIGLLRPGETLIESIQRHNPGMARGAAHEALAAFGFRNDLAVRRTGTLSGGERVRLALACIFSRPEPPQMLVLDEPTNHLDLEAIEQLESALRDYDGAIIYVTHDRAFLSAIGQWREISLRAPETF